MAYGIPEVCREGKIDTNESTGWAPTQGISVREHTKYLARVIGSTPTIRS